MPHRRSLATLGTALAMGLLLAACGGGGPGIPALLKTAGWRDGAADGAQLPDGWYAQLELAYDASTAAALWRSIDDAGPGGALADVDFTTQVVGLWSSGESGTCPEWLDSIATNGAGEVRVGTWVDGSTCTADYRYYSEIVVLDRTDVPSADALPMTAVLNGSGTAGVLAFVP